METAREKLLSVNFRAAFMRGGSIVCCQSRLAFIAMSRMPTVYVDVRMPTVYVDVLRLLQCHARGDERCYVKLARRRRRTDTQPVEHAVSFLVRPAVEALLRYRRRWLRTRPSPPVLAPTLDVSVVLQNRLYISSIGPVLQQTDFLRHELLIS